MPKARASTIAQLTGPRMITAYSIGNEKRRDEAIHRLRTERLSAAEETRTLLNAIADWNEAVRLFGRAPVNDNSRPLLGAN
jgi:hypothetical protein